MADARKGAGAVRRYLEALDGNRPKRGRKRTPDSVHKQLERLEAKIGEAPALQRLALVQQRLDLERELQAMEASSDIAPLEDAFVEAAKGYSDAKGISYTAWRELGVSADVLQRAGIKRTRRS